MDNRDFSNIGEQIRRTIDDALNATDYRQLNQTINNTVNMAMDEARRQFGNYRNRNVRNPYMQQAQRMAPVKKKIKVKPKGRGAGILMTVLGTLGVLSGLPFCVWGIFMTIYSLPGQFGANVAGLSVFLLYTLGMFGLAAAGLTKWFRYTNFKKYLKILDGREFCSVKELADKSGQTEKKVCKNLRKMLQKGMFEEGFLDEQGTSLIVTNDAYRLYCQALESKRQREKEASQKAQQKNVPKSAVDEMIEKGSHYIRAIREANDAIPGAAISAKLDRLELVVRKIFESVKKHPEQMDEMDKFMEYYLPTTEKLVNAYKEFDAMPIKGENVTGSMAEIEKTLDTISHAFEQLLDDLFMDAAFDISSDISVLQSMLAREGYKEKDFK